MYTQYKYQLTDVHAGYAVSFKFHGLMGPDNHLQHAILVFPTPPGRTSHVGLDYTNPYCILGSRLVVQLFRNRKEHHVTCGWKDFREALAGQVIGCVN